MAKGKIIVMRLFGGLGNQLFQYAFLFALSRQGGKARLETSSYEHDDKRVCELHHFRVSLPIEGGPPPWAFRKSRIPACLRSLFAAPKYPHFREEKRHGFDPGLAAPPRRHTYFKGYFQTVTAIHSEKGQARILLIGGSVMRHLWRPLASELQEDIDLFSSTLIPGDPDYLPTLAGYFPSAGYEAVIVSFGSHVTNKVSAISVDDFRKNYMAFVSQLSKRCRFLILATSTSIMDGPDGTLNEEKEKIITAFNAIVREAASSLPGAVLSDHHDFMQGRRYIDPFHFSPPDRAYQAGKTAGLLLPLLSARQEPPKEQECPKSRPEP